MAISLRKTGAGAAHIRAGTAGAAHVVARLAIRSLHSELVLYPKPGLVSLHDSGAHEDMDASTLLRGLASLRHYFVAIALAGAREAPMAELRRLGVAAETRMLAATRGINTHRGAIFSLGLLAAAIGRARAQRLTMSAVNLREALSLWHSELTLVDAGVRSRPSHGAWVAQQFGASGARGEAQAGYPSVFDQALPALRHALSSGADERSARIHAFFVLLASVTDTNVLYRGGAGALQHVHAGAADFLAAGSVFEAGWNRRAETLHRYCCASGVSPGGCADLLAATIFVHEVQTRLR